MGYASEFKTGLLKQVAERAKENFKDHTVEQRHKTGDCVRQWVCSNNGSSVYRFVVTAPPGWLIIHGDMGECMWSRLYDMLEFARSSIHSLDYFSEKASRDCIIKEDRKELIDEWIADTRDEIKKGNWCGSDKADKKKALADLNELVENAWKWDEDPQHFIRTAYHSDLLEGDFEALPSIQFYTHQYLWKIEALKWFIAKLDAGDFTIKEFEGWETPQPVPKPQSYTGKA